MVSSCTHLTTVDCSSHGYRFAQCRVPGAGLITSITVARKYSRSSCTLGRSYGPLGGNIWVHHGCRAQFAVCYETVSYKWKVIIFLYVLLFSGQLTTFPFLEVRDFHDLTYWKPDPEVKNTFFMLNAAEHEIFSANEYENVNDSREIFMLSYV